MALISLALAASIDSPVFGHKKTQNISPNDIDVKPPKKIVPNGCKEYTFSEEFGTLTVVAINEKSALRKYNKWCEKHNKP